MVTPSIMGNKDAKWGGGGGGHVYCRARTVFVRSGQFLQIQSCTVEVNKKFTFRFRCTIVLRKQLHSFRYAVLRYGVNRSTLRTTLPKTIGCEV